MQKRFVALLMSAVLVLSSITGCASKYGNQTVKVENYPDCYEPIKQLRDNENSTAKGVGVGAALGCGGGALIGLLAGGWRGAIVGCIAGGVAGGATGAYYAERKKEANENTRMAAYLRDLDGDISNLDIAAASARSAIKCYKERFYQADEQFKNQQISKYEYDRRYSEIKSGLTEAQLILGRTVQDAQAVDAAYRDAFTKERYIAASTPSSAAPDKSQNAPTSTRRVTKPTSQAPKATTSSSASNPVQGKYASYQEKISNVKQTQDDTDSILSSIEEDYKKHNT